VCAVEVKQAWKGKMLTQKESQLLFNEGLPDTFYRCLFATALFSNPYSFVPLISLIFGLSTADNWHIFPKRLKAL
jgi:hypothetical protein